MVQLFWPLSVFDPGYLVTITSSMSMNTILPKKCALSDSQERIKVSEKCRVPEIKRISDTFHGE